MSLRPLPGGAALPRRSFEQFESAPGVVIIPNRHRTPRRTELQRLAPGDLLFWDASADDARRLDHVGIYLGVDPEGRYRFISSRKSPDGPTMGDYKGASAISPKETNTYSARFRCARRI